MFFNELELNNKHIFSRNFRNNDSIEQIHFSMEKKYFITNLKVPVTKETEIEKWSNYEKNVTLSNFC